MNTEKQAIHPRKVSIIIPFYNEEDALGMLFSQLEAFVAQRPQYRWEILLINDGSTDASMNLVRERHAANPMWRYVDLSRNFGKEIAMLAGFDHATGDCAVLMDADLQDPPEVVDRMLQLWEEGYDDVYGRRISRGKETWLRRTLSLQYYRLLQRVTEIPVLENTGDFRLLDRICLDALCQMRETQRYTKGLYCWIGFRKAEVSFDRHDRAAGSSKWSFFKLLGLAIEGITSYTTAPLRFATVLGIGASAVAFILLLFYLGKALIWGDQVQGFPTLICVLLLIGGLILLSLGILGEYIGRIFLEAKGRPAYFVREMDGNKINKFNP